MREYAPDSWPLAHAPRGCNDAAMACVYGLTVATRNERDFKIPSGALFNPFRQ
jgi:predicted nucleic acid-binding protein